MEGVRTKHYVSKRTAKKHVLVPPPRPIIEHNCPVSFSHYRSLCHRATVRIADHVIVMITFARFVDCRRDRDDRFEDDRNSIRAKIRARTQAVFNKITP